MSPVCWVCMRHRKTDLIKKMRMIVMMIGEKEDGFGWGKRDEEQGKKNEEKYDM